MSEKSAVVVGTRISGLAIGTLLARQGMRVRIIEKNETPGGRARVWRSQGWSFDMGPTWYLMPEVPGVATGAIFGAYSYGGALGPKLLGVPLVIRPQLVARRAEGRHDRLPRHGGSR